MPWAAAAHGVVARSLSPLSAVAVFVPFGHLGLVPYFSMSRGIIFTVLYPKRFFMLAGQFSLPSKLMTIFWYVMKIKKETAAQTLVSEALQNLW